MNKRGQYTNLNIKQMIIAGIIILGFLVIITELMNTSEIVRPTGFWSWIPSLGDFISRFMFGINDDVTTTFQSMGLASSVSGIISMLMVWLIIFVAFGDIFETFSSFSRGIAWVIAFGVAVIAANVGLISWLFIWFTGIFVWAGAAAVYVGLLASFVAFFAVNWGITPLVTWLKNRSKMIKATSGATRAGDAVRNLSRVERDFERAGQ